jgi:Leucine-rich repeat (LRR) protein
LAKNSITDIDPLTFENNVRLRHLDVSENKLLSINPDTFSHNRDLEWLHFGSNSITYIHPSTFRNSSRLHDLNISGNKIISIDPETFTVNLELKWLNVNDNSITDIHPSTFRGISKLRSLHISENKLASISPGTFDQNRDLQWLVLSRNRITDIHPSVFRRNSGLRHLDISGNKITLINPYTFIHNKKLTFLYLQYNNISHVNISSFRGLEQLKHLDLSNNNIDELNPHVFDSFSIRAYEQNHQVSKLQHLNLAKNKIRFFNFELYFPMSRIFDTSILTFELESLNVSSNRLDSLGAASVKWLNHRTTVTDLSGNPWNCDCSALGEAWRELKHKLTLNCASPYLVRGQTWDVIGTSCPDRITYVEPPANNKQNASSGASPNMTAARGPALNTTLLVANGVLLVCTIVGVGFMVLQILKKVRKGSEVPEQDEVCVSLTQRGSSCGVSSRLSLGSTFTTGNIYERID